MSAANHPDPANLLERVERLEAELALAIAEIKRKDRIIEGLRHRLFGASSEKLDPAQLQLMFDEVVLGKPAPSPDQSDGVPSAPEGEKPNVAKNRRTKADRFPKNLKIIVEAVLIPDEVKANPNDYDEISEEHHDELDVIKPEMIWRRTIRKKFVFKADKTRPPVIAPAPLPSIPGTLCAPALAAQIIVDKFEDHLPHYRQSKRFRRRHDVDIGRQTINSWNHCFADHLTPLGKAMKAEVLQATELQVDETPIEYLKPGHGSTKLGYLWIYNDPLGGTCYYDWHAGRGHGCLLDFLGYDEQTGTIGYAGTIQCDGFSAYSALAARFMTIRLAGCLAHIRRKFVEAMDQAPEITLPILRLIQRIYLIEKQTRQTGAPPACRELIRRSRSRPIADELHRLIVRARASQLPHGLLGEALTYAINQWDKFIVCLENGRLEVDNNLAENKVRPAKLGARNWMFFGSLEAGANNALLYTLMANCKIQGLDPEMYLTEVIKRLPHNATAAQAAELTPARFAAARRAEAQAVA
ncbi:MAG: IS66 family transposase [Planctomycetota bacterium]